MKRRKVFQVAAVYAVVAWLLVQIIVSVETPLSLPPWSDTLVIVLLAVGFPVVLILGWIFDLSPEGIRTTGDTDHSSAPRAPAPAFTYVIQGLVLVAVGFLVVDQYLLDAGVPQDSEQTSAENGFLARYTLSTPTTVPSSASISSFNTVAISPDGTQSAWVSGEGARTDRRIYRRPAGELEPVPVPGTEGAYSLFFSADGQWIGFVEATGMKKVSVRGGPVLPVTDGVINLSLFGANWTHDDTIVFATDSSRGLLRVSANGGEPTNLTSIDSEAGEIAHSWPDVLPDGQSILLTRQFSSGESRIAVYSPDTGIRDLWPSGSHARYSTTGHLVYAAGNQLWALGFDPDRLEVTSASPEPVEGNVQTNPRSGAAHFDLSDSGSLLYATAGERNETLILVDRDGDEAPLGFPARGYSNPRLSPDGTRLSVTVAGVRWWSELSRPTLQRLSDFGVLWLNNETLVGSRPADPVYEIMLVPADSSGSPQVLARIEGVDTVYPEGVSDDYVVFMYQPGGFNIGVLPLNGDREWFPLYDSSLEESSVAMAPDGELIAYQSNRDGPLEIYLEYFPSKEGRKIVSSGGGENPVWSHDGTELYYQRADDGDMMVVRVEREPELTASQPVPLFPGEGYVSRSGRHFDVLPDGRFLMIKESAAESELRVVYVQDFDERLRDVVREN